MVYLLAPLGDEILRALPAAAERVAALEGMRRAGRPAPVESLPEGTDDTALIEAARRTRRPLGLAVAGDRAAVLLQHERADGVEGARILRALLSVAVTGSAEPPERPASLPLLRAVRAGGWSAVRAYLGGRGARRALPSAGTPVEQGPGRFASIVLDRSQLAAVRRTRSRGGRATVMSRVASISLAALAELADPAFDVRVVVPVDLRHLVPGRRVAGNLVSAEPYGTLRVTDWSPANFSRLVAARRSTAAIALLASTVRAVLRRRRTGGASLPSLSVSLMGDVELPSVGEGVVPSLTCAAIGPSASTFVFVAQVDGAVAVSFWDDTGAFDVDGFPAAFLAEVERRTP